MKQITFVIPSRNNLDLLKLCYKSIKDLGNDHHILVLNDASVDGTEEWLKSLDDNNLHVYTNPGPDRVGIVGMFDKGIEMASTDIIFAFHADMVAGSRLDVHILQYLEKGKVVCATRIEPPLHPEGVEKVILDCGVEPESFNNDKFQDKVKELQGRYGPKDSGHDRTNGIFAPWCMYKEDYLAVGGHDELFAPQSREDSDLFNRFLLKGYDLIQSWESFVYHFTSRGSRYNKYSGGDIGKDSPEWQMTNHKNMRNFTRKWGTMVQHDEYMLPIVTPKYDIAFVVYNCTKSLLGQLEPWCSKIYLDLSDSDCIGEYIKEEQPNTTYDLNERIKLYGHSKISELHDICVEFDCNNLTMHNFQILSNLPKILQDSGEIGEMELEIYKFWIKSLNTYEKELIVCEH